MDCNHVWTFYRCGIDGDSMRGIGPQRATFRCAACGDLQRFPIDRDTLEPDTTKPYYATPLRPQWSIDQARAESAALLD